MIYNYKITNKNHNFSNIVLKNHDEDSIKTTKSFYLSLKRNLLANLLVFTTLINSLSYSSKALYNTNLNNFNSLLINFENEENDKLSFIDLLNVTRVTLNQLVEEYRTYVTESTNRIANHENNYQKIRIAIKHNENLTDKQLNELLCIMCDINSNYSLYFEDEESALKYLFTNPDRKYEEKMIIIMIRENLTFKELDTICASVVAESGSVNNYEESYHVASVLDNRRHSKTFVEEAGPSLYDQLILEGQFSVVANNSYQAFLEKMYLEGYQGAIDMFYTGIPSNNYLFFLSKNSTKEDAVQLTENGNKYYSELEDEDRIENISRIDYTEKHKEDEIKLSL